MVNEIIEKALQANKFEMTITDIDGEISLKIVDFYSLTKTTIDGKELNEQKGLNIGGLSKMLIQLAKPKYREIVKQNY